MGRRTLLLLTSLLIAALGTALVAFYVVNADERAAARVKTVQVLLAKGNMQAGTLATEMQTKDYIKRGNALREQVVEGSTLVNATQLAQMRGQVLRGPVAEGQVLSKALFRAQGDPSAEVSSALQDEKKMMVSVQMADPNRVAAYIRQNVYITVFLTTGVSPQRRTKTLVARIRVVAVGSPVVGEGSGARTGAGAQEEAVPTTVVTLEADEKTAQRLILAQGSGELYFALLGTAAKPTEGAITNEPDL